MGRRGAPRPPPWGRGAGCPAAPGAPPRGRWWGPPPRRGLWKAARAERGVAEGRPALRGDPREDGAARGLAALLQIARDGDVVGGGGPGEVVLAGRDRRGGEIGWRARRLGVRGGRGEGQRARHVG